MKIPSLQNVRNFLMATLAFLMLSVAGVYIYSMFFEEPYLRYAPLPFPVNEKIYPGTAAAAIATRCNSQKTTLLYKTTRKLLSEGTERPETVFPSVDVTAEPGCTTVVSRLNVVPPDTPPGFYRFVGIASVPGLVVEHKVSWNTEIFEVISKPPEVATAAPLILPIANATVKIEVKP